MNRRTFLTGLLTAIAAPAIVHASSIMPVKVIDTSFDAKQNLDELVALLQQRIKDAQAVIERNLARNLFGPCPDQKLVSLAVADGMSEWKYESVGHLLEFK